MAWLIAKASGGTVALRIEDLDKQRSKPEFADQIMRDYEMLGLFWDGGPTYQADHSERYEQALQKLSADGSVYPCVCTRAEQAAARAPHVGEVSAFRDPCEHRSASEIDDLVKGGREVALRLRIPHTKVSFEDQIQGPQTGNPAEEFGNVVLKRKDGAYAYQLAVVLDDANSNVTSVVRGSDLLSSTYIQRYLQNLLGLEAPLYAHVPLLVNDQGKRLSKRDRDADIATLLATYQSPERIIGHLAYLAGLIPIDEGVSPEDLLASLDTDAIIERLKDKESIVWR